MKEHSAQVDYAVALFGSQTATADALRIGKSAISNWREAGIPRGRKLEILELAVARGLPVDPSKLGISLPDRPQQADDPPEEPGDSSAQVNISRKRRAGKGLFSGCSGEAA